MFGRFRGAKQRRGGSIEDWEVPVGRDLLPFIDFGPALSTPYQPRWFDDMPADAAEALTELVDVQDSTGVLVLPSTSRPTHDGHVYVPTQVFGVGTRGVALWVDDLPHQRVASVVRYNQIAVIEHVLATDYGQLTVVGAHHRLVLRYRDAAWPAVHGLLTRLRASLAGVTMTVDSPAPTATWDRIAEAPLICLTDPEPELVIAVDALRPRHWPIRRPDWPATKAVLTSHELVVLRETTQRLSPACGVDLLAVPRTRITDLRGTGAQLTVTADQTQHTFDVPPHLAAQLVDTIAPVVFERPASPATTATVLADGEDSGIA